MGGKNILKAKSEIENATTSANPILFVDLAFYKNGRTHIICKRYVFP